VWYWDRDTILVYNTGMFATDPANILQGIIQNQGMKAATDKVVSEISMAFFGKTASGEPKKMFPGPSWGRCKGWPEGSLADYRPNITGLVYAQHMARPLGGDVPIWYGNSEASSEQQGWIEGSMEFVFLALPVLSQFLSSNGEVLGPTPTGF
jgi:hypothetical protein